MAPRPKEEDLKIQCTPQQFASHIDDMSLLLSQEETEHNWQKFQKSLATLVAMTRGGAYKFDNYVALVGPPDKGVGDKIVRCIKSERAGLSKSAFELLLSLAPRLRNRFTDTLRNLYIPALLTQIRVTNKITRERAEACLFMIMEHCPLPNLLRDLAQEVRDKNDNLRKAVGKGCIIASEAWAAGGRVAEIESVIRALATDKDVEARKVAKDLWAVYKEVWPDRVDAFSAPLSPTTRKRLDIRAGEKPATSSSTASGPVRTAKPKPINGHPPSALSSTAHQPFHHPANEPHRSHPSLQHSASSSSLSSGPSLKPAAVLPALSRHHLPSSTSTTHLSSYPSSSRDQPALSAPPTSTHFPLATSTSSATSHGSSYDMLHRASRQPPPAPFHQPTLSRSLTSNDTPLPYSSSRPALTQTMSTAAPSTTFSSYRPTLAHARTASTTASSSLWSGATRVRAHAEPDLSHHQQQQPRSVSASSGSGSMGPPMRIGPPVRTAGTVRSKKEGDQRDGDASGGGSSERAFSGSSYEGSRHVSASSMSSSRGTERAGSNPGSKRSEQKTASPRTSPAKSSRPEAREAAPLLELNPADESLIFDASLPPKVATFVARPPPPSTAELVDLTPTNSPEVAQPPLPSIFDELMSPVEASSESAQQQPSAPEPAPLVGDLIDIDFNSDSTPVINPPTLVEQQLLPSEDQKTLPSSPARLTPATAESIPLPHSPPHSVPLPPSPPHNVSLPPSPPPPSRPTATLPAPPTKNPIVKPKTAPPIPPKTSTFRPVSKLSAASISAPSRPPTAHAPVVTKPRSGPAPSKQSATASTSTKPSTAPTKPHPPLPSKPFLSSSTASSSSAASSSRAHPPPPSKLSSTTASSAPTTARPIAPPAPSRPTKRPAPGPPTAPPPPPAAARKERVKLKAALPSFRPVKKLAGVEGGGEEVRKVSATQRKVLTPREKAEEKKKADAAAARGGVKPPKKVDPALAALPPLPPSPPPKEAAIPLPPSPPPIASASTSTSSRPPTPSLLGASTESASSTVSPISPPALQAGQELPPASTPSAPAPSSAFPPSAQPAADVSLFLPPHEEPLIFSSTPKPSSTLPPPAPSPATTLPIGLSDTEEDSALLAEGGEDGEETMGQISFGAPARPPAQPKVDNLLIDFDFATASASSKGSPAKTSKEEQDVSELESDWMITPADGPPATNTRSKTPAKAKAAPRPRQGKETVVAKAEREKLARFGEDGVTLDGSEESISGDFSFL